MIHTYQLIGMTCNGCEAAVKSNLLKLAGVKSVDVSRATSSATINTDKHISLSELQNAIGGAESKYQISVTNYNGESEEIKSWFENYKPIILIFTYILMATSIIQISHDHFDLMVWMRHFMAGFFLVFSFFKLLNLKGFVESYAMYDLVAKRFKAWGFIYAFTELGLGIAYLINFQTIFINAFTFIVMSISIIGVLQSVLNKQKIQCACLGVVFNLPMSTVTIVEDGLMIVMSGIMLLIQI